MPSPNRSLLLPALAFVGLCLAVGAVGSIATASSVQTWYPTLVKPSWNPPNWLFGPVWTILYAAMGIVGARLWSIRSANPLAGLCLRFWLAQLALNAAWSPLFFGLHALGWALLEILLLLGTLVVLTGQLRRLDPVSFWLWLPYLAWVAFATALNATLWHLN